MLFSKRYLNSLNYLYFFLLIWVFTLRMVLLILRNSPTSLIFAWEGLGVTSYLLVLFYYNWNSIRGANITILTNRWGDAFILLVVIFYDNFELKFWCCIIFLIIILTKRAIYPFRGWLPAAIAAPTPVSALVHSRTLVTAGFILIFKFKILAYLLIFKYLFIFLGIFTMIAGSLRALITRDVKKLVAFSTLRQLGFLLIRIRVIQLSIRLFHLLAHAFLKSIFFILIGKIIFSYGRQFFFFLKKILHSFKLLSVLMLVLFNFFNWFFCIIYFSKEIVTLILLKFCSFYFYILLYFVLTLTLGYTLRIYRFLTRKNSLNRTNMLSIDKIFKLIQFLIIINFFKFILNFFFKHNSLKTLLTYKALILILLSVVLRIKFLKFNLNLLKVLNSVLTRVWKIFAKKEIGLEFFFIINKSYVTGKNKKYFFAVLFIGLIMF